MNIDVGLLRPRRSSVRRVVALACLFAIACGQPDDGAREGEAAAGDSTAAAPDTAAFAASPDSATAISGDPFEGFELPPTGEPGAETRRLKLLLRNAAAELAIVYADGGAGEVLLDSVAPGEETRVDILTRAVRVGLRSESGESGAVLLREELTVDPDSVIEVLVGRGPSAP